MSGLLWTGVARNLTHDASLAIGLAFDATRVQTWNERLWRTLSSVAATLHERGVEIATIKGVTSEGRWYDRLGERPCIDVDLLVGPDDLGRLDAILDVLGPGHPLRHDAPGLAVKGLLQSVELDVDGVTVDLHFDVFKLGIPCRQSPLVWERTVTYPLPDGGTVRVLDPETALVLSLLHLTKNRFRFLLGFVDVARIVEREDLDWAYLEQFLAAEGLETPCLLALEAVAATIGLAVPPRHLPGTWRRALWQVLWRPSVRLRGAAGVVRYRHRQQLLAFTGRGRDVDGARLLARSLFPAPSLIAYRQPGPSRPYVWRISAGRIGLIRRRRREELRRRDQPTTPRSSGRSGTGAPP